MKTCVDLRDYLIESLEPRRLFAAGELDTSFGDEGRAINTGIETGGYTDLLLQPNGKVVVAGEDDDGFLVLHRYLKNGEPDTSFDIKVGNAGLSVIDFAYAPDGKIYALVHQGASGDATHLYRFTKQGELDSTWGDNGDVTPELEPFGALVVQASGKLIFGTTLNGDFVLQRYELDGDIDTKFGENGTGTRDLGPASQLNDIAMDRHGRVVAAGQLGVMASNAVMTRFKANGDPDSTFGTDGISTLPDFARINRIELVPHKWIVAASLLGGTVWFSRYDQDGNIDSTFGSSGGVDTTVLSSSGGIDFAVQTDGKILFNGSRVGVTYGFVLARLTRSGALDEFFGDGGIVFTQFDEYEFSQINQISVQTNGRVIAAGMLQDNDAPMAQDGGLARYVNDVVGDGIFIDGQRATIHGTLGDDILRIRGEGSNGLVAQIGKQSFNLPNGMKRITMRGFHGDDVLRFDKDVAARAFLDGMEGEDELFGGSLADHLIGGAGSDELTGRNGRDTLEGGSSRDFFFNRDDFADDVLGGKGSDLAQTDNDDTFKSIEDNFVAME